MVTATNRILLKKGDVLRLAREPAPENTGEWKITGYVGEGGSAVCYSAIHRGKTGRLKEFYPADTALGTQDWFFFLTRTGSRQLVPVGEGMRRRFEAMCDDFVQAYRTLDAVKAANTRNELLNNYIPPCEVLYGFAEDGARASCYIWTPDDRRGQGFDGYLRQVRQHPDRFPEHKLYHIFCTLITLTDCIQLLHEARLLHLDIKPSNFLVTYDSAFNINPGSISLFDISTLSPMDSRYPRVAGTPGYQAPEVARGRAENRSDLYSLGAVLFYATVITDEPGDGLYRDRCYGQLERLVAGSRLIQASDTNANVFVRYQLTRVLQKCLAPRPADRYGSCEELKAALEQLRAYLIPQVESGKLGRNRRLAILDTEQADRVSPSAVIHNLLFQNPLYNWAAPGEETLNVLAVGAGTYGQKFIDICLQAGQMRGCRLHITALSDDPALDRTVYLQVRPALPRFVSMDGGDAGPEPYAGLSFRGLPGPGAQFQKGCRRENRETAAAILGGRAPAEQYRYIFIALGDDALNEEVAAAFVDAAAACRVPCTVNFVVHTQARGHGAKGNPVCINAPITAKTIDPQLERMAFNTHLCWNGSPNTDPRHIRREFREKYNYLSSLSYALSIPYKLHSVGIAPGDPAAAADAFYRRFSAAPAASDADALQQLVALEHRRWVLEKVTDGWDAPRTADGAIDVEGCVRRGSVKSKAQKLHPCIVKSSPGAPLLQAFYRDDPAHWDTPQPQDAGLDELDRLSLALHRCFFRHAQAYRKQAPLQQGDLALIRRQILREPAAVVEAFNRYQLCLQNVLNGSRHYTRQYAFYEADFRSALQAAAPAVRADVSLRLDALKRALFPVLESNLYRNYKAHDETLVRQIPFILAHTTQPGLAMLFDDAAQSGARFRNAASATVLCPARLTYLYHCGADADSRRLDESLRAVLRYFDARGLGCRVSFVLVAAGDVWQEKGPAFRACLDALRETTRLHDYTILTCPGQGDAAQTALRWLQKRRIDLFDGSPRPAPEPLWDEPLCSGARARWPSFVFDAPRKAFVRCSGCEELRYLSDASFLRVEDLFTLGGVSGGSFSFPEFAEDHPALWRIYTGESYLSGPDAFPDGVRNWNCLCDRLAQYSAAHDTIADIPLDGGRKDAPQELIYFFPDSWFKGVQELLRQLIACGAAQAGSSVCSYTSDTCRAVIRTCLPLEAALDRLFSTPGLLTDGNSLQVTAYTRAGTPYAAVRCDSLFVQDLPLEDPACWAVLEQLQAQHFIRGLRQGGAGVCFLFSSLRLKRLLTNAGEMVKLSLFYELNRLGYFDDIACGYTFSRGRDTYTLDCVATKGFCSLFIACGPPEDPAALPRLAAQFGVHAQQVRILAPGQPPAGGAADCVTLCSPGQLCRLGDALQHIREDGPANT